MGPEDVIQACYLIPAFKYVYTTDLPLESMAHQNRTDYDYDDYAYFYVNQQILFFFGDYSILIFPSFVDRNVYMWFNGEGIGHNVQFKACLDVSNETQDMMELHLPELVGTECPVDTEENTEAGSV